ncbi:MAG: DUF1553 domain-containing protein [Candidatus Hydrogenedentes bacterium]|nr:DUF1553 domain-containing protein [Candidatus Hydrogenedentota bacterium]
MANSVLRAILCVLLGTFVAPSALLRAEESPPTAAAGEAAQPADELLKLLDTLKSDPQARKSLEDKLRGRIEQLKNAPAPDVTSLQADLDTKTKRAETLKQQQDELAKQLEASKAELEALQAELPELSKKLEAVAKERGAPDSLALYEQALQLLSTLNADVPLTPSSADPTPSEPTAVLPAVDPKDRIDFNKEIRHILSNNCFACHGPDVHQRKAGLRLDDGKAALEKREGHEPALVPGSRDKSELWKRITCPDPDEQMPPANSNRTLTPEQIELLGKWIDQGAVYDKHWAFKSPVRPDVPEVALSDWPRNPIDNFILTRLEKEGLKPSPQAAKETLIRRVSLDLTGLPPTPEQVEAFLNDSSPDAYEKVVDSLLASPHYGENMARMWLDLARYADTNGYHIDNERYMWRWRDWVIDSFNRNMPFDEFTVDQLAGDLLPDATLEQKIATGFNRNHMISFEGGIIPEEYRIQYVNDRVNTTSTVWLGLTVNCTQCHDHKFDPLTQKEFYQLSAFFSSIPEQGSDGRDGNSAPLIKAPLPEQSARLAELNDAVKRIQERMDAPNEALDTAQAAWDQQEGAATRESWIPLAPKEPKSTGGATLTVREDHSVFVDGTCPEKDTYEFLVETDAMGITALRLDAIPDTALPKGLSGRAEDGTFRLTEVEAEIASSSSPQTSQKLAFVAVDATSSASGNDIAKVLDGNPETGWTPAATETPELSSAVFVPATPFGFEGGTQIRFRLKFESPEKNHTLGRFAVSATRDASMAPSEIGPWYMNGPFVAPDGKTAYDTAYGPESGVDLNATYEDHRLKWVVRPDLADGALQNLPGDVAATYLYRVVKSPSARQMRLALGSNDALKLWVNDKVVLDQNVQRPVEPDQNVISVALEPGENRILMKVVNYGNAYAFYFRKAEEQVGSMPLEIRAILGVASEQRSPRQIARLRDFYREKNSADWREMNAGVGALREQIAAVEKEVPSVMVMEELEKPRETFVLNRGAYDQPGEKVEPETPGALIPFPADAPRNRLGYAKWLTMPEHPLTSRVTVNRYWMHYFGTGIVKTIEDFGVQGEWPSHPELMDWLATEFVRTGWDVKAMQRLIVTSATYMQSSAATPELLEKDPENRLLARGPRFRMEAEQIRDNALAISGLLVARVGGPSVKPYQPKGVWEDVAYGGEFTAQRFVQDYGDKLYRRSMYTFWKRQAPPPSMLVFDAPSREVCTARRPRTNTPLQALALLNDPQFVEAARALAERMMGSDGDTAAKIARGFELAVSRKPRPEETQILSDVLDQQLTEYRTKPEDALNYVAIGESGYDTALDPCELAAWTSVATTILNLDETISKT